MTETQIKRTRETNPIYQGEYTIEDYQKDRVKGFTTGAALEFVNRFSKLPPEEKDRLKRIDEQAKARYTGATEWDVGGHYHIEGYDYREIDPLDYYQTFYELEDGAAILKRLDQLNEMAAYMELRNTIYLELKARAKKRPDLKKALKEWATVWNSASLQPINQTQELKARLSDMAIFFGCENPPDYDALIDDEIAFLRKDAETMKGIIDLGDLEALRMTEYAPIVEITEAGLTEDVFNQSFEPFRKTHKGKGLEDARLRVARSTIYHIQKVGTKDIENVARENLGGEILTQEALSRCSKNEPAASVLPIAKENPIIDRASIVIAHGPLSNEIGHKNPNPEKIQLKIDKDITHTIFRVRQNKTTVLEGHVDMIRGKLTSHHQTVMSSIASVLIDSDPKAYEKGSNIRLDILETELIGRCRGIDIRSVTPKHKEQFRADMWDLKGAFYVAEWGEYMATHPDFRDRVKRAFPEALKGDGHVRISLIDYDMYRTTDQMGNTSWRYVIKSFPILDYMDINTGMASKLRYSIKEAPVIPWGEVPDLVKEYMEALSSHKSPSIRLFKIDKNGGQYIPALKDPLKSDYMDRILKELESYKRYDIVENLGYFDMDLSRIYEDVWGDPEGTNYKIVLDRKTALLSYLYRLWIIQIKNPEIMRDSMRDGDNDAKIHGLTVLTKGKSWTKVRIYLSEPTEKIVAIGKDPTQTKRRTG